VRRTESHFKEGHHSSGQPPRERGLFSKDVTAIVTGEGRGLFRQDITWLTKRGGERAFQARHHMPGGGMALMAGRHSHGH